jgi:hypothetical protein
VLLDSSGEVRESSGLWSSGISGLHGLQPNSRKFWGFKGSSESAFGQLWESSTELRNTSRSSLDALGEL